jgi:sarcosine oxidase, subunit beta
MKKTADVIIIGGGVNGCAAAYYLAKAGQKNVIVLEGSPSIGHGASSRNGGGVRQSGRDVRELPYAMYGIRNMWPTLSEELGADVEYCQAGNLRLGKTPAHMEKLKTLADSARSVGLDVEMIDAKEAHERNPFLSEDVIGASWCPTDGHANPLRTTLAYYRRALDMGVQFVTDAPVTGLKKLGGVLRRVITEDGTVFEAETVILCAGYESRAISRTVGIELPLSRFFDEALVTEAREPMFDMMLGVATGDFYGHQAVNGTFVFGAECGLEDFYDTEPGDNRTFPLTMSTCCRAILSYIPALHDISVVRSWGGWLDMSPDGVPVLGKIDEVPGLIIAAGFNGHGFGTAPAVGLMLAQMAMDQPTVVDLSALRYDRFHAVH